MVREHRETRIVTMVLVAVVIGVLTLAVLQFCDGHLTYTLDDPYIHLALAKNLRHLHYGLNAGEVASPASSILWPWLLAPFAGTAVSDYVPLVLNLIAALALALLVLELLRTLTDGAALSKPIPTALAVVGVFLCTNVFTTVFVGMEHVAHAAATAAVAIGLIVARREQRIAWWLTAGLIVGPALRYEGIIVTAAGVIVLFVWGHRRHAVTAAACGAVPVLAFAGWSITQGLSPLPSSVLVKSTGSGGLSELATTLNLLPRVPLPVVLVGILIGDLLVRGIRKTTALHVFALVIVGAQLTNRDWGSLSRYLTYTFFAALPVVAFLFRDRVVAMYASARTGKQMAAVGIVLAIASWSFVNFTFTSPRAAQNIYLQQAQMGRFVEDYWQRPVAVNDLGEVSLHSDHYVLDLWGLGNETARKERLADRGVAWMDELARQHKVGLVMIYKYDRWFPEVPKEWTPVGKLSFDVQVLTASHAKVTFYATNEAAIAPLQRALQRFAPTLPEGASFALS